MQKLDSLRDQDPFVAKATSQVYYLRSLSTAFFECDVIRRYIEFLKETKCPDNIKDVLADLGLLYGLWSLEKHLGVLYESGYIPLSRLMASQEVCAEVGLSP